METCLLPRAVRWSCNGALLPSVAAFYSSVVAAAQQESESYFKPAQEEELAVQTVFIAQITIPYLLWAKTN